MKKSNYNSASILHSCKGFTIVELAMVIVFVGILLTTAIGIFSASTNKAYIDECATNIETINSAIVRAAAIDELSLASIGNNQVNKYIEGGISSLQCKVKNTSSNSYNVVRGVITPAHNH